MGQDKLSTKKNAGTLEAERNRFHHQNKRTGHQTTTSRHKLDKASTTVHYEIIHT